MNLSRTSFSAAVAFLLALPVVADAQPRNASRVDFDDQLVQGQVNRGAVHLIERKDSDLGSLVKVRKSYRKEILAGTPVEAAVSNNPATADMVVPKGLPVVKPAEAVVEAPKTEAKADPKAVAKTAPAKAPARAAKPAAKPAPKSSSKQTPAAKTNGGSRVVSRR